jgi:hypothetical protein
MFFFSRPEPVPYLISSSQGNHGSSWDLSYLLSLQEAMIILMGMKMSHRLHMVSLFRDGLIELVAILSGRISG